MIKLTKKEMEVCTTFINKILDKCQKQTEFYTKIAQNADHSEDFVNRMTDMATSFEMISQFVEISANSVFDELQFESLGDSTLVGQVEQTATENALETEQTAVQNDSKTKSNVSN